MALGLSKAFWSSVDLSSIFCLLSSSISSSPKMFIITSNYNVLSSRFMLQVCQKSRGPSLHKYVPNIADLLEWMFVNHYYFLQTLHYGHSITRQRLLHRCLWNKGRSPSEIKTFSNYSDFLKRHLHLRNRLLDQGYKKIHLIRSLKKFIFWYQYLVEIYSVPAEKIISDAFSYSENV